MNELVSLPTDNAALMEQVIAKGDLSKMSQGERTQYYVAVCNSIGLNPFTQPFEYITLNGKMRLYAKKDATDQLRKINAVSIQIMEKSVSDGLMTVHVRATDKSGRFDEDLGVVNISGLKGEGLANAILKTITKAKRRVTLSISGLGFLDETEVEDIPASAKVISAKSLLQDDDVKRMQIPHFTDHLGEVTDCKSQQQFLDLLEAAFVVAQSRKDVDTLHENNSWALSNMRQKDADGTMLSLPIDDVYAAALLRTAPNQAPVNPDWQAWAADLYKALGEAVSYGHANDLWLERKDAITQFRKDDPAFYAIVEGQFKAIRAKKPRDAV